MNELVKVIWRMLRTIAHSLMVHVRVLEAYINFALMYTTDHIFLVPPIKDLINKDIDLTTTFKLVTGTKLSVSHLRVLFSPCVVQKAVEYVRKGVKYVSPGAKVFLRYLCWNSTASKMVSCVQTRYKEDNIFI